MNYKGIVNWLQEDGFVLMGVSQKEGEITLMEKHTGKEVNDLSSFLIATVLPIAKKKVAYILLMQGGTAVHFQESVLPMLPCDPSSAQHTAVIRYENKEVATGNGATGEYAMVNAIENFIKNQQEKINDKG